MLLVLLQCRAAGLLYVFDCVRACMHVSREKEPRKICQCSSIHSRRINDADMPTVCMYLDTSRWSPGSPRRRRPLVAAGAGPFDSWLPVLPACLGLVGGSVSQCIDLDRSGSGGSISDASFSESRVVEVHGPPPQTLERTQRQVMPQQNSSPPALPKNECPNRKIMALHGCG